jgi:hypothetical protein
MPIFRIKKFFYSKIKHLTYILYKTRIKHKSIKLHNNQKTIKTIKTLLIKTFKEGNILFILQFRF